VACVEAKTAMDNGAIGPEAHPNFIGVFSDAPVGDGHRTVEGAGEDGQEGRWLALGGLCHRKGYRFIEGDVRGPWRGSKGAVPLPSARIPFGRSTNRD